MLRLSLNRQVVGNERDPSSAKPAAEEPASRPLPLAVCLLIWAAIAAAGWAAIILAIHLI